MTHVFSLTAERNNGLTARTVPIDTPEGRRYIAQVNLNGNWHDVVDYRAIGRMEETKRAAREHAAASLPTIVLYWEGETGITSYTPEMGEAKPQAQMEVSYCHGGGHWVTTPLNLKTGRSIRFEKTYTEKELMKGSHQIGWNLYYVTDKGLEMLEKQYTISREVLLD